MSEVKIAEGDLLEVQSDPQLAAQSELEPEQKLPDRRSRLSNMAARVILASSLFIGVPGFPMTAQAAENSAQSSSVTEQETELQYDLSDYRLPFDGTFMITQGRSDLTIDGQPCTAQFHTTHQGLAKESIDFLMEAGVPLKSVQVGEVVYAGWLNDYGNAVIILHQDGLKSWYGHLSKIGVSVGEHVDKGTVIGASGKSGTSAPHFHFEIRDRNNQSIPITIDGLQWFGGFESSCSYKERFEGYGKYQKSSVFQELNPQLIRKLNNDQHAKSSIMTQVVSQNQD